MIGLVLAAGFGKRLLPFTEDLPKALMPVAGIPAIEYALRQLEDFGVEAIGVNGHHHRDQIENYLKNRERRRVPISFFPEMEILGTAGGVRRMSLALCAGPYLITNADMIADVPWKGALRNHAKLGAEASMILFLPKAAKSLGVMKDGEEVTDLLGRVQSSTGNRDFLGASILEQEIAHGLPESGCLVRDGFLPMLQRGLRIGAYDHTGEACDLGTPGALWDATMDRFSGNLPHVPLDEYPCMSDFTHLGAKIHQPVMIHPTSRIGRDSEIGPCVSIGQGASIGEGAKLVRTIVLPKSIVAPRLKISHSIVGPRESVYTHGVESNRKGES